jgi:hypothetical protein
MKTLTRPTHNGNLELGIYGCCYIHPARVRLETAKRSHDLPYLNRRASPHAHWVLQIWVCTAFLGVDLDHIQLSPHPLNQVVQTTGRRKAEVSTADTPS